MFKNFQALFNNIMENVAAGNMSSEVFGTPQQPNYNPPSNIDSGDTYAPNDGRNLFGGVLPAKGKKRSKKNSKKKVNPLVIRRNLQRKAL
jgi:hypothetical protein